HGARFLERPFELRGRREIESAGRVFLDELHLRLVVGALDVMADRAADAFAAERAVLETWVLQVVDLRILSRVLSLAGIELELSLPHRVVAGEAEVDDFVPLAGMELRDVRELAVELRVENRIAPGQPHRRPAPLAER